MASRLIEVPLGLHLEFGGGRHLDLDLSTLPAAVLVGELARALLARSAPTGPVASPVTAAAYRHAIARFVRWLDARGFIGGARQLNEALVFDYWRSCPRRHEGAIRALLAALEQHRPGTLAPAVVAQLAGVALQRRAPSRPRRALGRAQTERLLAACRATVTDAEAGATQAQALVAHGGDPAWPELGEADLAWLLDHAGPHSLAQLAAHVATPAGRIARRASPALGRLHRQLFPTREVVVAFAVLVALETGIGAEAMLTLGRDCLSWAGADAARLDWYKGRGGGPQSHVFASRGRWSPGRLVERWLALSARARRFAAEPEALWLCWDPSRAAIVSPRSWAESLDRFVAAQGLCDETGAPLRVRFATLRATYFARHDRAWSGALRIDPTHSARVEGDHYLAQSRACEAIEATVEAAQSDALHKAEIAALSVLGPEELARLGTDAHAAAVRLDVAPEVAAEVVAGQRDVFAASCKDFHHSPYGAPGEACPVPAWVCLSCPLAVFVPSKVPNLLRLRDHFEAQWAALPTAEWLSRYGAASVRLERHVLPQFPPAVIAAARASLDDSGGGDDVDPAPYLAPEERLWTT